MAIQRELPRLNPGYGWYKVRQDANNERSNVQFITGYEIRRGQGNIDNPTDDDVRGTQSQYEQWVRGVQQGLMPNSPGGLAATNDPAYLDTIRALPNISPEYAETIIRTISSPEYKEKIRQASISNAEAAKWDKEARERQGKEQQAWAQNILTEPRRAMDAADMEHDAALKEAAKYQTDKPVKQSVELSPFALAENSERTTLKDIRIAVDAAKQDRIENAPVVKYKNTDGTLNITKAIDAGYTKESDYEGWKVTQPEINAIVKVKKERDSAQQILKPFNVDGELYSIADAVASRDPKIIAAAVTLFGANEVKIAQEWVDRNWGIGERRGGEIAKQAVKFYRELTPWDEYKGQTLGSAIQDARVSFSQNKTVKQIKEAVASAVEQNKVDNQGVPPIIPIVGSSGGALSAAGPIINVGSKAGAVGVIISLAALGLSLTAQQKDAVNRSSNAVSGKWYQTLKPDDVVIVSQDGTYASSAAKLAGEKTLIPPLTPKALKTEIPGIKATPANTAIPGITATTLETAIPAVKGREAPYVTYLPTPTVTKDKLVGDAATVIKAQAAVTQAEQKLKASTATIPIDWNKVLNDARKAQTKEDIAKAFSAVNAALERTKYDQASVYGRAYLDYLKQRAILEAAKKSYVASLNPTPITGTSTDASLSAYAVYSASQMLQMQTVTQTAIKTATATYTKALTKGATATQAMTAARTAVMNSVRQALRTNSITRGLTASQVSSLTKALAASATATAIATSTSTTTGEATRPAELTKTAERTAERTSTGIKKPKKSSTDEEKREFLKKTKGMIARRRGELGGKSIWRVKYYPYRKQDTLILVGKAPEGAKEVRGIGSVAKSAVLVRGEVPDGTYQDDTGAVDDVIKVKRGRVQISSVRDTKIPKPKNIKPPSYKSVRKGKIFYTRVGSGTLLSRNPIGRRGRR